MTENEIENKVIEKPSEVETPIKKDSSTNEVQQTVAVINAEQLVTKEEHSKDMQELKSTISTGFAGIPVQGKENKGIEYETVMDFADETDNEGGI